MLPDDDDHGAPPADWPQRLIDFWFAAHGKDDWYGGGGDFDAAVAALAADWHAALRHLPATAFLTDPATALAAIILFDQVPRNIYRRHADAFASDALARAIARGTVAKGWDRGWPDERRQFAYLPFEHSENMADQHESLRLMGQLADPAATEYAKKHFAIIERFGRFPHRNGALGRTTRSDEQDAVEQGKKW